MKVAYLCTQDISNQIFIDTFKKYNLEIEVIIENNKKNRNRTIKKKFHKLNLFEKFLFPLDLLSLVIYKKRINTFLKKKLNLVSEEINQYNVSRIQDINSQEVYKKISEFNPDLVFVRGTTIIKEPLINHGYKYFLNIHGGIVPNYRNVHGQFWSYYFRDYENMGSSILHITKGIDNGNIAITSPLDEAPKDLKNLHLETLILSNKLLDELISKMTIENKLDSYPQNSDKKAFYGSTPRLIDFLRLITKKILSFNSWNKIN